MPQTKTDNWNADKNEMLTQERGMSFERIVTFPIRHWLPAWSIDMSMGALINGMNLIQLDVVLCEE